MASLGTSISFFPHIRPFGGTGSKTVGPALTAGLIWVRLITYCFYSNLAVTMYKIIPGRTWYTCGHTCSHLSKRVVLITISLGRSRLARRCIDPQGACQQGEEHPLRHMAPEISRERDGPRDLARTGRTTRFIAYTSDEARIINHKQEEGEASRT